MRGIVLSTVIAAVCLPMWAADDNVNADEIIRKFAAKETEFAEARNNYTYRQTVKLEELDAGGNPTGGKWELDGRYHFHAGRQAHGESDLCACRSRSDNILLTPEDDAGFARMCSRSC